MFGTHSLRRTKATLIYRRTGNLRAVQLLLGHSKIESTVRYLGIEVDDALAIAEQIDVRRYPGIPSDVSYRRRSGRAAAWPAGLILTGYGHRLCIAANERRSLG